MWPTHFVTFIKENYGTKIPENISDFLEKYKDSPTDLEKAGLDYAITQINELLENGVNGIHIYTMNKPFVAKTVLKGINR